MLSLSVNALLALLWCVPQTVHVVWSLGSQGLRIEVTLPSKSAQLVYFVAGILWNEVMFTTRIVSCTSPQSPTQKYWSHHLPVQYVWSFLLQLAQMSFETIPAQANMMLQTGSMP